jgi:uncharacterized membrane protein YgcG
VKRLTILLVGAIFFGAVAAAPAVAQTTDSCDEVVVDSSDHHVLKGHPEVLDAAYALQSMGIDVRVRVLQNVPRGNLDDYEINTMAACGSWHDGNGNLPEDMLIFVVSVGDRSDKTFFGKDLMGALQDKMEGIRVNYMISNVQSGYYAEGLAGAEQATADAIKSNRRGHSITWILILVFAVPAAIMLTVTKSWGIFLFFLIDRGGGSSNSRGGGIGGNW